MARNATPITRLSLLVALSLALTVAAPLGASAHGCHIEGMVTAAITDVPGFEGLWKYSITFQWDTEQALSHANVFLALQACECVCEEGLILFPDPAADPAVTLAMTREAIRWSLAWLIVAFPVFLVVARSNEQAVRRNPLRRLSKVRRWLTYLTLFVGAAVLIGVLTTIVYNLLSGELTVRFVLQVVTIAVITGSVFGYLLSDVRKDEIE